MTVRIFSQSNMKGFSLLELIISLTIVSIIGSLTISVVCSEGMVLKKLQGIRVQSLITSRVDQYINEIVSNFDKHPVALVPRVSSGLGYSDGSAIRTKSINKSGSDILYSIFLEERSLGDVFHATNTSIDFDCYGYCPKDEDYVALSFSGIHEVHLTCKSPGVECELTPLTGILFPSFQAEDIYGITKVIPIKKRLALFADDQNNLRLLGFSKNEVNENQPVVRGLLSLHFTAQLNSQGILTITSQINPGNSLVQISSRIGRASLLNLELNPL